MKSYWRLQIILLIFLGWYAGCGPKVHKENLGPEEYFEYAKKKFDDGDYFEAATDFTVIVLKFSGNPIVDDAQFYLAECHFQMKEYLIAVSEYEKLVNDYPESPYAVEAKYKIGLSYYKMSLRPELDQEYTQKAYRQLQLFIEEFPTSELRGDADKLLNALREKLARKKLLAATTYRKMGAYQAAVIYYDIILQDYYDTKVAAEAQYWKGVCLYDMKKWENAREAFTAFVEKYPEHKFADEAKKRIEEITEKLEANHSPQGNLSQNEES